ncbi:hydroxysqualene dehydroxylase HpnE [Methylocapsa acidiphila]|uniref:hydroxysqualene dehydroxylase HpnE n=1 Tax=Methylocapsa acidiphila TaxID=133552 RepID=UPI000405F506|nr:hydroxysqualene dehydroxylase HpnE [Methylocapsa acidiphila]
MPGSAIHVVGAGLAGLAAAVRLADGSREIILHEAARQAGGRCRSYHDAQLGMTIDNGNHLLLSGNVSARNFLAAIGGAEEMQGPDDAEFSFVDLASMQRWVVRPNAGPLPWWIFSAHRRTPGSRWSDHLALLRLLLPGGDRPIAEVMRCEGALYERLWRPFLLAALNTEPKEGSRRLAAAVVRETLAKGGVACRPLVAAHGLSAAFIEPALRHLAARGAQIRFDHRLKKIIFSQDRIDALDFGEETTPLGPQDHVILAVPPNVARELLPELETPESFRAIVNAHFKIPPPADLPPVLGVINGTVEWIFAFPDRISITISGADRLLDVPREELAQSLWAEVVRAAHIEKPLPPWQIIKEKRATFAATVAENTRRPDAATAYANLTLAGDWTATGLPATIEGAIRSGDLAADLVARSRR